MLKLDPALLTALVGTVIPFLTAFVLHRNAKNGIWPATKAVLALAGAVLIAIQQHDGIVSRETVVIAVGAFITAHVTDWGVLHQTGTWSWLLDMLGGFGIGKPPVVTPYGFYANGGLITPPKLPNHGIQLGDSNRASSMAAHPSNLQFSTPNWSLIGDKNEALAALVQKLTLHELLDLFGNETRRRDIKHVERTDARDMHVETFAGDVTLHAPDGSELFGAPIPADLPVEALPVNADSAPDAAVPANTDTPQLWAEDAAGTAAAPAATPIDTPPAV